MYIDNQAIAAQLHKNWYWYLLLGVALVIGGTFAIIYSFTATIFSVIYLAGILLLIGVIEAIQALRVRMWDKFFLHLILAALYLLAGGYMLINPVLNALTLTLILAAFFAVSGLFKIIFALAYNLPHRGWIILNGALSLLLAFLIWQQWPASGLWVIGMFVGIDAILTGWSWIMLALRARKIQA